MCFRLLIAIIVLAVSTVAASATPITYIETFIGSGALNGVSFTNQLVTFTGIGDTTNVTSRPFVFFNIVTGTVQIGSGGVDQFNDRIEVFDAQVSSGLAGFSDATKSGAIIEDTVAAPFLSYDLRSAVSGTGNGGPFNSGSAFPTALGNFDITNVSGSSSTFSATLATAATAEPSTFALLGTGILGLAGVARRKLVTERNRPNRFPCRRSATRFALAAPRWSTRYARSARKATR
jgi:hypothetical protein